MTDRSPAHPALPILVLLRSRTWNGALRARLDVDVTLVGAADRLLPREDAGVSATVHRALGTGGVDLRGSHSVQVVLPSGPRADTLRLNDGSEVEFDRRPDSRKRRVHA